jgi:hypothetical protein
MEILTIKILNRLLVSTNISSRIEDWIQIIPLLIDIAGLEGDEEQRMEMNQEKIRSAALVIVKMVVATITHISSLHQLLDKDIRFMTYLKWTLDNSRGSEETREGLQLIARFQSIDCSLTSLESFKWLRGGLQELQHSVTKDFLFIGAVLDNSGEDKV